MSIFQKFSVIAGLMGAFALQRESIAYTFVWAGEDNED
jgi:hypothetical protein